MDRQLLVKKLFFHSSDNIFIQFIRGSISSFSSFLLDFGILALLTLQGFFSREYVLAAVISYTAGLFLNYFFSVKWAFSRRNIKNRVIEFTLFAFVGTVGLLLNVLLIYIFTDFVLSAIISDKHLRILSSKIISGMLIFIWNFTMRKNILFRNMHEK